MDGSGSNCQRSSFGTLRLEESDKAWRDPIAPRSEDRAEASTHGEIGVVFLAFPTASLLLSILPKLPQTHSKLQPTVVQVVFGSGYSGWRWAAIGLPGFSLA